jgi:hypothetical protein
MGGQDDLDTEALRRADQVNLARQRAGAGSDGCAMLSRLNFTAVTGLLCWVPSTTRLLVVPTLE